MNRKLSAGLTSVLSVLTAVGVVVAIAAMVGSTDTAAVSAAARPTKHPHPTHSHSSPSAPATSPSSPTSTPATSGSTPTAPSTTPTTASTTPTTPSTAPTTGTTTQTSTPAAGGVCTSPVWTTEATGASGEGRTFGAYYAHNNMWNNHLGGDYRMGVCDYDSWYEVVDQPHPGDNGVQAYPNVHKDYNDEPLANISSARFAATSPHCAGCIYNVAFDIWINQGLDNELMIWTDNWNQRPAGNQVGTTTIGGHTFQVWKSGGATSPGGVFTYVATPAWTSGTMPLQTFFSDLQSRGWIPANSTTWQVDFGVEVVSTESNPERFDFTDFSVAD